MKISIQMCDTEQGDSIVIVAPNEEKIVLSHDGSTQAVFDAGDLREIRLDNTGFWSKLSR